MPSSFRPHPLFRGAHLQTLAQLFRPSPRLALRRERLELADGDFLDVAWSGEHNTAGPFAVLVHGLAGGFESKYLLGTACRLIALGWRTVILQLRGAGPEPNRLHRCYDQADTEDLRYFWHLLRARAPGVFIGTAGWSLGGNVTLKALAEEGETAPIDVAAAVSVPFSIRPCIERLCHGFSRIYQKHLLGFLKAGLRRKHPRMSPPPRVDLKAALAARNFLEYDKAYTAPLGGYQDVEDYYTRASCGQFLRDIHRTTLVVHALDDPFMTAEIVPREDALSPYVTLELAPRGGHVGFVSAGGFGRPYFWLEQRLTKYLHEAFERSGRAQPQIENPPGGGVRGRGNPILAEQTGGGRVLVDASRRSAGAISLPRPT